MNIIRKRQAAVTEEQLSLPGFEAAKEEWQGEYDAKMPSDPPRVNRSGIEVKALYTPEDWNDTRYLDDLGFPSQAPYTRGVYSTMHRGRPWSQRQLIGFSTPEAFNRRQRQLMEAGTSAVSLIPCNSVFRGYDVDGVEPEILGTCGAMINNVDHMATALDRIPYEETSFGLNDPSPFTLAAFLFADAKRKGVPWNSIAGTSNQSDYLSHYVANHMFFRLALPGARRVLLDHIAFMRENAPRWNYLSVVGQHMQQAGATPAEAMALTLCSGLQYAQDCVDRGMNADTVLPRFSFFFDISVSFFEEVAKFRAGRRLWARLVKERFDVKDPKSLLLRFHAQTSGSDLTRQQPLNNIARATVQAMAGILGGLQSLHTDSYDEALSVPTEKAARIAIATQNLLREEVHLDDVIDPMGGSYYVESLTNEMEARMEEVVRTIDEAGGMYAACEAGLVQKMIGQSAMAFQEKVERGEEKIVGVNAYQIEETAEDHPYLERTDPKIIEAHVEALKKFKVERDQGAVIRALDDLARAANSQDENVYEKVVAAAGAGVTHGEICHRLRDVYGFGRPQVVA